MSEYVNKETGEIVDENAEVWVDVPDDAPSYSEGTEIEYVKSIPVMTFEGALITEMEGKLPAVAMAMESGYARGTHLRFNIEVRVKNVRYEENKHGDMVRQHIFALESIELAAAFAPEKAADDVGGSASGATVPTAEEAEELGVKFGRSADQWGGNPVELR